MRLEEIGSFFEDMLLKSKLKNIAPVNDLIIVTGADQTHAKSLFQFLKSLKQHEPDMFVLIYDLGLNEDDLHQIAEQYPHYSVEKFNYSDYPEHFNITINSGEYAWKPIIIRDVLNRYKQSVCWMDAGNRVVEELNDLRKIISYCDIYSPISFGTVREWTHPRMLENFEVPEHIRSKRNRSGGCVALNYNSVKARSVIEDWVSCATNKECIAPEGSDRRNHRQDQAVLTILLHLADMVYKMPNNCHGFQFHQDID